MLHEFCFVSNYGRSEKLTYAGSASGTGVSIVTHAVESVVASLCVGVHVVPTRLTDTGLSLVHVRV